MAAHELKGHAPVRLVRELLDCLAKSPIAAKLDKSLEASSGQHVCREPFAIRAVLAAGGGINATAKALGVGNGLVGMVRVEIRVPV